MILYSFSALKLMCNKGVKTLENKNAFINVEIARITI